MENNMTRDQKELLKKAATEFSNFGIIFDDTLCGLVGDKPKDGHMIVKYYTKVGKLLDKVAVMAANM